MCLEGGKRLWPMYKLAHKLIVNGPSTVFISYVSYGCVKKRKLTVIHICFIKNPHDNAECILCSKNEFPQQTCSKLDFLAMTSK